MLRADEFSLLEWESNPSRAQLSDVLRVHDYAYVQKLGKLWLWWREKNDLLLSTCPFCYLLLTIGFLLVVVLFYSIHCRLNCAVFLNLFFVHLCDHGRGEIVPKIIIPSS